MSSKSKEEKEDNGYKKKKKKKLHETRTRWKKKRKMTGWTYKYLTVTYIFSDYVPKLRIRVHELLQAFVSYSFTKQCTEAKAIKLIPETGTRSLSILEVLYHLWKPMLMFHITWCKIFITTVQKTRVLGAEILLTQKTTLEYFHHGRAYVCCLFRFSRVYKVQQEKLIFHNFASHKKSGQTIQVNCRITRHDIDSFDIWIDFPCLHSTELSIKKYKNSDKILPLIKWW